MNKDNHLDSELLRAITLAVREALGSYCKRQTAEPRLVFRMSDMPKVIGLSPSTIRNFIDVDSPWFDPSFPAPIRLGTGNGTRCSIGWRRVDIEAWVASRPVHRIPHQVANADRKGKSGHNQGQHTPQHPVLPGGQVSGTSGYVSNGHGQRGDAWPYGHGGDVGLWGV